jgi:hypothetical protein
LRAEVVFVGAVKLFHNLHARAGQAFRRAKNEVALLARLVAEGPEKFITQAEAKCKVALGLPSVLEKQRVIVGADLAASVGGRTVGGVGVDGGKNRRVVRQIP